MFYQKRAYEDHYAYLLMKSFVFADHKHKHIRYLLVDECQDYSYIQYMLINKWFPNAHITILGDMDQSLNHEKNLNFSEMLQEVFKPNQHASIELNTSYRSTDAIVELANRYHPSRMVSVGRPGKAPEIIRVDNEHILKHVEKRINKHPAIITQTMREAKWLYKKLSKRHDVQLLNEDALKMTNKVLIMPIYYAKGLEFDEVIYINRPSKSPLKSHMDYTAISRAKHEITLLEVQ
jgi:DNA helicase-2/ATP-dependent DNA helicase PcrA